MRHEVKNYFPALYVVSVNKALIIKRLSVTRQGKPQRALSIWHSSLAPLLKFHMGHMSLREALATAKSSQYIIHLPFENHHPHLATVLCITACPSQSPFKEKFLKDYEFYGTTDLTEYIEEDEFDVLVIGRNGGAGSGILAVNLHSFMEEKAYQLVA